MDPFVILTTALLVLLCWYLKSRYSYWSSMGVPTGFFLPFLGHTYGMIFMKNLKDAGLKVRVCLCVCVSVSVNNAYRELGSALHSCNLFIAWGKRIRVKAIESNKWLCLRWCNCHVNEMFVYFYCECFYCFC